MPDDPTTPEDGEEPTDEDKTLLAKLTTSRSDSLFIAYASVGIGSCLTLLFLFIVLYFDLDQYSPVLFAISISLLTAPVLAAIPYIIGWRKKYRLSSAEVEKLLRYEGKRFIGLTVDLRDIEPSSEQEQIAVTERLRELLSQLTDSDARLLTRRQKQRLFHFLLYADEKLMLAILGALEQVGDESQLSGLRKFASTDARVKSNQDVLYAADACFAAIEARRVLNLAGAQLLRPTSSPTHPDTLLRANPRSEED